MHVCDNTVSIVQQDMSNFSVVTSTTLEFDMSCCTELTELQRTCASSPLFGQGFQQDMSNFSAITSTTEIRFVEQKFVSGQSFVCPNKEVQ